MAFRKGGRISYSTLADCRALSFVTVKLRPVTFKSANETRRSAAGLLPHVIMSVKKGEP